jgi:hypothetical protein
LVAARVALAGRTDLGHRALRFPGGTPLTIEEHRALDSRLVEQRDTTDGDRETALARSTGGPRCPGDRRAAGGAAECAEIVTDTVPVSYAVTSLEHVSGRGDLVPLAAVEIEIANIPVTIQGVRVVRRRDDLLAVEAPTFKSPRDGRSTPAILLPPALRDALATEVIEALWRASAPIPR